jgi:hypothetical protein
MADSAPLDRADRTPIRVLDGMLASHTVYKRDECIPCGAVIKMGFFFDGFGRHRDQDDPTTSRYSNICRLWEAHRDMRDTRRQKMPNHFWYRFYYSGLGTKLNQDAANHEIVSAAAKTARAVGKYAAASATSTAQQITGVDKLLDLKKTPLNATKKALSEALDEKSFRPIARVYDDLVAEAKTVPGKLERVLSLAQGDHWVTRGKAAVRATLYDITRNPLNAGGALAREVFAGVALDSIPMVRDSAVAATLFGTGVDVRLDAALRQFESAYRDAKEKMPTVQRIEVSVFGADRGGVLARAFTNALVKKYQQRSDVDLAIDGDPIQIKFLGLLDAVSSLIAENRLLEILPLTNLVKQNHGDRALEVPQAVRKCVHFAAAHELRFYQRLDSLEKTRGEQYLYPGTSEDITGGAPDGLMGFRAELQRVALRDMLHEALMAGAAVDPMEGLKEHKLRTYEKFTLAKTISEGKTSYKILDLIKAYRTLVPRTEGLNFQDHMQVFQRWLAVRYQSPLFRATLTKQVEEMKRTHRALVQQRTDAEAAYQAERQRSPLDQQMLGQAYARLMKAQDAEQRSLRGMGVELNRPVVSVWERLEGEAHAQLQRLARQDGLKESIERTRKFAARTDPYYGIHMETSANMLEQALMSPEELGLAQAWQDGVDRRKPLPDEVMALFDLLVHDTMLTSWHDHLLSSMLYFQTRETDTFGESDIEQEARQHAADERAAQQGYRLPPVRDARAGTGFTP